MPIEFRAPGPFSPDTSIQAGMAQMYMQSLPAIGQQQHLLANLAESRARLAAVHPPTHVMQGPQAQPYQPAGGGGGGFWEPPPPQPDRFTQAENLRLQQLEAARVQVESRVQSGEWTPEEGNDAMVQINTGYNILDQRRQRAQAGMQEQQHQQMMQEHARMSAWQNMSAGDRANRFNDYIVPVQDEDGNVVARMYVDPATGRANQVTPDRTNDPQARLEATQRQLADIYRRTETAVRDEVRRINENVTIPPEQRPAWTRSEEGIRGEVRRRHEETARVAGISIPGEQSGRTGGGGGQTPPSQPVLPDVNEQNPFDPDRPETMSSHQRDTWARYNELQALVERTLPARVRGDFTENLRTVRELLRRRGDPRKMTIDELNRFQQAVARLAQFRFWADTWVGPRPEQEGPPRAGSARGFVERFGEGAGIGY